MRYFRNTILWAILLATVYAFAPAATFADDSELFTSRVWPNVLLMVDKSGSMKSGASGSSGIGNLIGDGTSYGVTNGNKRIDALWKVVYTLLNADGSIPPGSSGGVPITVTCLPKEYNIVQTTEIHDGHTRTVYRGVSSVDGTTGGATGTPVSNIRLNNSCGGDGRTNWGSIPASGAVTIHRTGMDDSVTYTSRGLCPGDSSSGDEQHKCIYFSSPVTFTFDHGSSESLDSAIFSVSTSTSGYDYKLPYPAPASVNADWGGRTPGVALNEHQQAIGPYLPNITSADEKKLKARIGLLDFTGTTQGTYSTAIVTRVQIPSNAQAEAPFPVSYSYRAVWDNVIRYAIPNDNDTVMTPTAQSLAQAKGFFQTAYNSTEWCRPNHAILITDGEDTMGLLSGDQSKSQSVRNLQVINKAAGLYTLNDNANINLFTVGVGIGKPGDSSYVALRETLRRAADQNDNQATFPSSDGTGVTTGQGNGRGLGKSFFASDASELAAALGNIFTQIASGNYVFTSPTVSSVRTSDRNYLFLGTFQPKSPPATLWEGHLYSYSADNLTTLHWDTDNVLASTTAANRKMYSAAFDNVNSLWSRILFNTSIAPSYLGVSTTGARDNVVNYVRGTSRTLKLGDIFHSKPVLVGEPSPFYSDPGYSTAVGLIATQSFLQLHKNRDRVVYAGANDGTLHAFHAGTNNGGTTSYTHGTGQELFAYVPKQLLGTLKDLVPSNTSSHQYWVDSSPRVADVWIDSNGNNTKETSEWKTVMVTGLRKGGNGYFALDITNPSDNTNYPNVLWEYTDSTILANSWSEPYIGKVKVRLSGSVDTVRDRWVAVFGGGSSGGDGTGKRLIVLDIGTGIPLKVFGPTGIDNEIAASPTALLDANGYIRHIYVPDLSGNLYRFNLSRTGTEATTNTMPEWTSYKMFAPTTIQQPAYHRAEVATVTDSERWVYFGTGNQDFPVSDTGTGKFFGIRNTDLDNTTVSEGSLSAISTEQINSTAGNANVGLYGWVVSFGSIGSTTGVDTLSHSGEKVLSDPVVFNGNVFFTTYTPTTTNVCTGGGVSRLYGLQYQTAGAAMAPDTGQTASTVSRYVWGDRGVASSPTLSISPSTGLTSLFVGFSGTAGDMGITNKIKEINIPGPTKFKNIKSWKEIL
jgi:hypothetical protein